ncbi:hypothetical protein ACFCVY_07305 [Streptomyces sp. NPDC056411]|uniref:hypothetical protein n=1 Tax=Streptomyces sp. NPDC056411 TaxID=3345813 RepID=UPI0035DAFB99
MTTGSVSRALRAAVFAVVCVTTAALGHALMSAHPLPRWALVVAWGITGPMAWWLAGRERGGLVVTGSTVMAQLGLHALLDLAQTCPGGTAGMANMTDMPSHATAHLGHLAVAHGDMSQLPLAHSGHGTPGMFLAHALAAVVCGLWLWRGEAAAFRLTRSAAAALFAPLLLVLTTLGWAAPKPPPRPVADSGHVVRLPGVLLHHILSRRGPPRLSVSS